MAQKTFQEENWSSGHGNDYNLRNPASIGETNGLYLKIYGLTRSQINKEFLDGLPRDIKILEVGANVGVQLAFLQEMGFKELFGVDINREAIEMSKKNFAKLDIIESSALNLPFKDNFFDLVFTSGVLIHISPADIKQAMKEIFRCSKKYIWGFEYFAEDYTEIEYRGQKNMLWKANFSKLYLELFPNLRLTKEKKVKYLESENVDAMFLLEKKTDEK